jgi:hypothetical protein
LHIALSEQSLNGGTPKVRPEARVPLKLGKTLSCHLRTMSLCLSFQGAWGLVLAMGWAEKPKAGHLGKLMLSHTRRTHTPHAASPETKPMQILGDSRLQG